MAGVGEQRAVIEPGGEQAFAKGGGGGDVRGSPDPAARQVSSRVSTMKVEVVVVETIGVRLEPAKLGVDEDEGEGASNSLWVPSQTNLFFCKLNGAV